VTDLPLSAWHQRCARWGWPVARFGWSNHETCVPRNDRANVSARKRPVHQSMWTRRPIAHGRCRQGPIGRRRVSSGRRLHGCIIEPWRL